MRRFAALLATVWLLGLASGCSTAKKDEEVLTDVRATSPNVRFEADIARAMLDGKDRSVTVKFTRKVGNVSESKDGVTAFVNGDKVVFTQVSDSPDEDRKLNFVVHPAEGDENVPLTIVVARKPAADVALEKENLDFVLADTPVMTGFVGIKAGRVATETVEKAKGVTAHVLADRVVVKVLKMAPPGDYWVKVKSAENKQAAVLKVSVKKVEPFVLDHGGKLEVKPAKGADTDTQIWVKAKTGAILSLSPLPPADARVAWQYHDDKKAIAITVAKDATDKDAGDYEFRVRGKDSAGKPAMVKLQFQVHPPQILPFVLEDDGKLEVRLDPKADRDTLIWVKARTGKIVRVYPPPADTRVTWNYDADKKAVAITVPRQAGKDDARLYLIRVLGENSEGKGKRVELKFKLTSDQ